MPAAEQSSSPRDLTKRTDHQLQEPTKAVRRLNLSLSISLCFHKNAYVFLEVHKLDAEIPNAPCCLQCEGLVFVTTLEFFLIFHRLERPVL